MKREHFDRFENAIEECCKVLEERGQSRENSLVRTKLQEAFMWFEAGNEDKKNRDPAEFKG